MKHLIVCFCWFCFSVLKTQQALAVSNPVDTLSPDLSIVTDDRALKLLSTETVFMENWINDMTFPYENIKAADLPELTSIPVSPSGDKFSPTWYGKLTSGYKWRWGRQHHGVDLALKTGDTVFAAWDGVVRYAQWNKSGYGNCVIIRHRNGLETLYAHMSKIQVSPNQYVSSGEVIGLGGNTGRSFGAHLHFEIRYKDFSIDPETVIDYNTLEVKVDTIRFVRPNIKSSRYGGDINVVPASSVTDSILVSHDNRDTLHSNHTEMSEAAKKETAIEPTGRSMAPAAKKKNSPAKKPARTYVIKKGDTYTSIAKKTGVSIATLKKLNPRQKETKLMPGKSIRIQ
jgi:murein DD-endopeptidase MepM/ murein hydrolase activator NlpD